MGWARASGRAEGEGVGYEDDEEGVEDGDDGGGEGGDDVLEGLELAEEAEHSERPQGADGADHVDGELVGADGEGEEGERDGADVEKIPAIAEEGGDRAAEGVEEELGGEDGGECGVELLEVLPHGGEVAAVVVDGVDHLRLGRIDKEVLRAESGITSASLDREKSYFKI